MPTQMLTKKLTSDEYNGLDKIASTTKMDCWFLITEQNGVDVVQDLESGKLLSLKDGVSQLASGMVTPIVACSPLDNQYGLTPSEIAALIDLFQELGI